MHSQQKPFLLTGHESPRSSAVRPPIYNSEDREFESHLELGNFSELSDVKTLIKLQCLDPNKVRHWIEQGCTIQSININKYQPQTFDIPDTDQ